MIIFYTFDYYETRTISAHYLIISLCSVYQQFQGKKYRIIIYTTNVLALTNYLCGLLRHIKMEIRHYDPNIFQQRNFHVNWSRYPSEWNVIGHSRVYLIPYLLHTYHEPVLYLDCDTGVVTGTNTLYDTLMGITYPFMNANENEYTGQLYGETIHFKPQIMDIKIFFYRVISTQDRTIYDLEILGQQYTVNNTTRNNGILYFPATELSMTMACETINVYEKLMSIYAYGFNDLNASTCVFDQHKEIPCRTMIPHRFLIDKEKKNYGSDTHIEQYSIPLTHYFTISWQYYGSQSDPSGYEKIITVYKEMMLTTINKILYQNSNNDWTIITGPPYQICENLLETIFFPKKIVGIFHPLMPESVSVTSILRQEINQFLRLKINCVLLSCITFILLVQKTLWDKLLNNQTISPNEWFDPTEQLIDINQLMSNINSRLQQHQIPLDKVVSTIDEIMTLDVIQLFLQIAMKQYPTNMLLTKNSVNFCPKQEVIVKSIEMNDFALINKYINHLDPNQLDHSGNNLLHYSVLYQRLEIQNLLHSQRTLVKCDVNVKNIKGDTSLHIAVKNNCCESVKLLLRFNADITLTDQDGKTAKNIAVELKLKSIHDILVAYEMKQLYGRHRRRSTLNV